MRRAALGGKFSRLALLAGLLCIPEPAIPGARAESPPAVPPHNRADLAQPPPRPPASEVEPKMRTLFDAIVRDDPSLAKDAFFPRPAFLLVKDIKDPGRYYDQLARRFDADIHALHARLPDLAHARYERFELSARGAFMTVGSEGNRLPYWAARHSSLYFRSAGRLQSFEVRVLITWDDHWYVIHLNEFH